MKIDNAIKEFTEKYDRAAIESIDNLANDLGLKHAGYTIKLFNLKESFDQFATYLNQYAEYKIQYKNDDKASSQDVIKESTNVFMENELFKPVEMKYEELPGFVYSYIEGVNMLTETIDTVKSNMKDADIELEAVGDVNDFADNFMTRLYESFDTAMNKILWASGYNSNKKLMNPSKPLTNKPVFL